MREYYDLDGTAPYEEECVQVDPRQNYMPKMREEARRYVELLRKKFPQLDLWGVSISTKTHSHDFGSYMGIRLGYDEGTRQEELVFFVESNLPSKWDDETVCLYNQEEIIHA